VNYNKRICVALKLRLTELSHRSWWLGSTVHPFQHTNFTNEVCNWNADHAGHNAVTQQTTQWLSKQTTQWLSKQTTQWLNFSTKLAHSATLKKRRNCQITLFWCQPINIGSRTRVALGSKSAGATNCSISQIKWNETRSQIRYETSVSLPHTLTANK